MSVGVIQELFAQSLARLTGLSYTAALAWSAAEVGRLNNLGIMSNDQPVAYPTPQAGAAAAAQLINSSPYYAGIRASVGGTPQQQMDAIARSPWHLGPAGLASAGGLDPYYARTFASFGYVAAAGASSSPSTSSSPSSSGHTLYDYLANAGISVSPTATYAQVSQQFLTAASNDKQFQPWLRSWPVLRLKFAAFGSTPINQIPWTYAAFTGTWNPLNPGGSNAATDTGASVAIGSAFGDAIGSAFGDLFAWVPGTIVGVGVLALVLVLAYSGVEDLLGSNA